MTRKLCIETFPLTGRGLRALCAFNAGELLLRVPASHIVTGNRIMLWLQESSYNFSHFNARQRLVLFILVISRRFSIPTEWEAVAKKWQGYSEKLPLDFETMPLCFDESELSFLSMDLRTKIELQRDRLLADFQVLVQLFPDLRMTDFTWAWCCVNTRCVHLQIDGDENDNIAMVPFFDMLNHGNDAETRIQIDPITGDFCVYTLKPIEMGKEALIRYGAHDATFLWLEYGFRMSTAYDKHALMDHFWSRLLEKRLAEAPPRLSGRIQAWHSLSMKFLDSVQLLDLSLYQSATEFDYSLIQALRFYWLSPFDTKLEKYQQHPLRTTHRSVCLDYERELARRDIAKPTGLVHSELCFDEFYFSYSNEEQIWKCLFSYLTECLEEAQNRIELLCNKQSKNISSIQMHWQMILQIVTKHLTILTDMQQPCLQSIYSVSFERGLSV